MPKSRTIYWFVGTWFAFLVLYAALSHYLRPGMPLTTFGDLAQCFVPLLANAGLLMNAGTPHWRRNLFWMLLALSCSMWMLGQFQWTYYEVYLRKDMPGLFAGDIIFFLRGIPLIAALALRPHRRSDELRMGLGYLDFGLLLTWWTFLYVFVVLPWMYATPTQTIYDHNYNILVNVQYGIIISWLCVAGAEGERSVAHRLRAFVWSIGAVHGELADNQSCRVAERILHRKLVRPVAGERIFLVRAGGDYRLSETQRARCTFGYQGAIGERLAESGQYLGDTFRDGGSVVASAVCVVRAACGTRHFGGA